MNAAVFSEAPDGATPNAPLLDGRDDFNVVFIHSRLDDYGLTPQQFRVYAHLARRAGNGTAWPAVATIAGVCKLHHQTVREALRVLVKHRLVSREPRPGTTPIYRITPAAAWHPLTRITGHPSESDTPPSVSEDTPTKRRQGHPYETKEGEGNPLEGDPKKEGIHTYQAPGLPRSEQEAVEQAQLVGVPPEFARVEFCRIESTGGVNGAGITVRKWTAHIRKRWADHQSQQAERRATGRPSRPTSPPRQFEAANYSQPVESF